MMNITLKPEQEQFIQNQIAQGRFTDAEAAINQALKLLQEKQREYEEWIEDVKVKVNEAGAELERGEGIPLETVVEQMQAKFHKAREAKK
jgi:antitoxin ParD1/3/4